MEFNSLQFLIFFPIVVLICFVIPKKIRYIWLLGASYYFYLCWNAKYALLVLFSTIITWLSGILIKFVERRDWNHKKIMRWKRIVIFLSLFVNLSLLFFFKYFNFICNNINMILGKIGFTLNIPAFDILLPVGISFYTFQALGYTIDVYRGDIDAEKNIFKYALFVSFFPQLVAGPIERSKNLLKQINRPALFNIGNVRYGLFTMAYGLFLKLVIADKIAMIIDPILENYESYHGMIIAMCIALFAFQIYCDFHGYTQIAIGSAKVLGYDLQENFNSPYLAINIKDFWRRWHISLTTWFTDYIYIPLGGNRKGKARKYINTIFVFLCSGLWHGASWTYVAWGGVNGLYLVIYDFFKPYAAKINRYLKINTKALLWQISGGLFTFLLVDYTWLYFRAKGIHAALEMQSKIIADFYLPYLLSDNLLQIFGSYSTLTVLIFSLIFLFCADYLQLKGIDWKKKVLGQQIVYRWLFYIMILLILFVYGVYGIENGQTKFIYFQF